MTRDGYEVFIGDQADPEFWRSFYASVGKVPPMWYSRALVHRLKVGAKRLLARLPRR
jgi:hypothetical protein